MDNTKVQHGHGDVSQNNATAGLEIGPTNADDRQGNGATRVERVPVDVDQQIQTANKFAALQGDDGETYDENQLAIVEEPVGQMSPIQNAKGAGLFNPAAAVFTPRSGMASSKRGKVGDPSGVENVANTTMVAGEKIPKESTAQWMQAEKGIEKAGITDSMQPCPAAEEGENAAKQITVAK
ncbi:hypothetical protein A4A49_21700 [Nicotiana attenuata]|uniref:Uncharacterized protein n=1 Tax=Nicotiana attenuata TaxID=49451 RepID=A0A1J6IFA9_NICAT|nr:hypothetical protein A4A49_21700 [Nicotiana attenuata]